MKKKQEVMDFREGFLTIDEVAKYLQLHKMTVYRLVQTKGIPAFKVGGSWRFSKEAIDLWADRKMNPPKGLSMEHWHKLK